MNCRLIVVFVAALSTPLVWAGDITGIWKHAEEPGWMEIQMVDGIGTGTVIRNDRYPERAGRVILKDLSADESKKGLWRGQVFVERLGDHKNTEVHLVGRDTLQMKVKVGFISRTLSWIRVPELPVSLEN